MKKAKPEVVDKEDELVKRNQQESKRGTWQRNVNPHEEVREFVKVTTQGNIEDSCYEMEICLLGSVVNNLPAMLEITGSSPGSGRSG